MIDTLLALISLTAMEIVLGIDNIVFIAILVAKLPNEQQAKARSIGISLALLMRMALLFSISWVMTLTHPLFSILTKAFSGRDLVLLFGGLFLVAKATYEIHDKLESGSPPSGGSTINARNFAVIITQICLLDLVFSFDSVITAVGMAQEIWIMVVAMILAVVVMLASSRAIGHFVHRHPSIKMLALSFLLLIGVMLVAEGMGTHINKGYIYFAMAFSLGVELLNIRYRRGRSPIQLHEPQEPLQT